MRTSTSARPRRLAIALGAVALATLALGPAQRVAAAPSPGMLTVAVGGASQSFRGGPITGSADASGSVTPVVCSAPACESIPLTLQAPAQFPAKSIDLTVTLTFTAAGGNPSGLTGLDLYIIDSTGATVASSVSGSSPAVATGGKLDPGMYTLEISGEAGAASELYSGTASARQSGAGPTVPGVTQSSTPVAFAPAAVVSPSILGAEPQISFERPVASPKAGAGLDPKRGFVDWPVSSRSMIGTLWRTQNGGDSYRQLVDLSCAPRQVPNCLTGGGGDTVNRVNNYDGTVNFGDQESLAQEAYASSIDHGDSFPATRQTAVTSTFSGVDRQWISTVDAPGMMAGPVRYELQAVYSYHIPAAGELVAGVGTDGIVRDAVPVIPSVSQSGPSRVDTQPGSPGAGYFYQGYRDSTGFRVGVARLSGLQDPTAYTLQTVSTDQPQVFPWINLDTKGNLYATWVAPNGQLYYSFSRILDPKNNPMATPAGVPGTTWSPKLKVNAPNLGSTVFPEVVAGDPGHIAIAYVATADYTGLSDGAPAGTKPATWNAYVSTSADALDSNPVFQTGVVSHQVVHTGSICTSGTACAATMGDRSLLDLIDITMDNDGRLAVVFTDNNNSFGRQEASQGSKGSPYVKVARLANGPSLLNGHGPYTLTYPTDFRASAPNDATRPNASGGANLPALDILGSGVSISGTSLVARIDLKDASKAGFVRDLAAYNAVTSTDLPASRLQYVARWDSRGDAYYLVAEADATGALSYYGGRVDASNALSNGNSAVGVSYRPQQAFVVSGKVQGNSLLITGRLSDFAAAAGDTLVSYASFSLAGPADSLIAGQKASSQVFVSLRTIDSSPPMDAVLGAPATNVPEAPRVVLLLVPALLIAVAFGLRRRRATPAR
ncbi:MAG: hypothetical protein JF887_13790 [Candidatus Dormibacteraeota bacterium]|uniref:MBG domain-containing protein n=1 Tax=Candidatus Amunia macphersoniae TaxID=3127014 RepID=A0A934KFV0_9BACT|nr:hypothetical protein [Candidatus Dormibacteraeota bacterium]